MINQLVLAFILSGLVTALAYWRGSLAKSGAMGALLVGTLIYGFGGWIWGVLLALFFVSSSLLSHYKEGEKQAVAEKFDKGHRRDFSQVMANGGAGAIVALLHAFFPSPLWLLLFVGVMATVTADTWATELGTLSKRP
ncbi:Phytyl-phosphate kinase, partial [hydrothermal vent metagenome]